MRVRFLWLALLGASALWLLTGWGRWPGELVTEPLATGFDPAAWQLKSFSPGAVYPQVPPLSRAIHVVGSWIDGDRSVGEATSPWFSVDRDVALWIAGYPAARGNQLELTFRTEDGRLTTILIDRSPGDHWELWTPEQLPPASRLEMRISARDGSKEPGGWLAFSEPVRVWSRDVGGAFVRLILTTAAVFCLVLGPGLAWLRRRWPDASLAYLPLPGLAVLLALGLLAWALRPAWSSALLPLALVLLLGWIARRTLDRGVWERFSVAELRSLLLVLALVCIGAAKAGLSAGPPDELFGGTISRTLESGDRSDSRIQYHVVQLVLQHRGPRTALSAELFAPYSFSSRGPLAGLISVPLVAGAGSKVATRFPNETWALFDQQGFAAYRLTCIVLAAISILGAFGFVEAMASQGRAVLAATLLAGCPFFVHEVYFTWPKLFSAYFALLALLSVTRGRALLAGAWLGLGYLAHPGALFAAPIALGLLLLREASTQPDRSWKAALAQAGIYSRSARILAGLALGPVLWRLLNRGQVAQGQFVDYLLMAYGRRAANLAEWAALRVESLGNTLLPLAAFFMTPKPGVPPPGFHRFMYQYWLSLPFAVGVSAVPAFLCVLVLMARRFTAAFVLLLIAPLIVFTLYWGATDAGMMREGLQPWFCVLVCLAAIIWPAGGRLGRVLGSLLLLRGAEILAMLLWPLWLPRTAASAVYLATDTALAVAIGSLVGWLSIRTIRELWTVADGEDRSELTILAEIPPAIPRPPS